MASAADGLAKCGHEVTLVASPGSMTPEGGRLITKTSCIDGNLNGGMEAANITSPEVTDAMRRADVIQDSSNFKIAALWAFDNLKHERVLQHLIGQDVWNVRVPKNVVAISHNHRQHIIHNSYGYQPLPFPPYVSNVRGIHVKDARVVYPDIDLDLYNPTDFGVKGNYYIWYSRFVPDKGFDTIIEIAQKRPDAKFKVFGSHATGDHKRYFYEPMPGHPVPYAQMIKDTPNIELLEEERIADMQIRVNLIARARAFVFPVGLRTFYAEAFGLVLLESLACGTPLLVSPYGSAPELVRHGKTGYVCADVDMFVDRLGDVDKLRPEDCRAEAEKFRKGTQAEELLKLYRAVLSGETW